MFYNINTYNCWYYRVLIICKYKHFQNMFYNILKNLFCLVYRCIFATVKQLKNKDYEKSKHNKRRQKREL